MRVQDGAERFLLPGDAEKRTENAMVDEGEPLQCGLLEGAASREQTPFDGRIPGGGAAEGGGGFGGRG